MARSRLLANITYLGLIQVTNYLVPLIAIPILLDRIGLGKYGIISLAISISAIFVTLTEYGYNLTGTRDISQHRGDLPKLRQITSEILLVKFTLVVVGFVLLVGLSLAIPGLRAEIFVILSTYIIVVAHGLFPVWYFQGIEKMEFMTVINFGARILYLAGILIFIRSEEDYIFVNLINGFAWMITAGVGFAIVMKRLSLTPTRISLSVFRKGLIQNFPIFLSKMTTAAHRNSALIIGGFFLSAEFLGLYAIFDKIIAAMILTGSVVFRAFFARVSEITTQGYRQVRNFFVKFLRVSLAPTMAASIALGALGPWLLSLVTSIDLEAPITLFFWLMAAIPLLLLLNIPLSLTLIAFNRRRHFFYYNLAGMIAMLLVGIAGAYYLQATGLIIATLAGEICMIIVGVQKLRSDFFESHQSS